MGPNDAESRDAAAATIPAPPPSDALPSVRTMPRWMPPEGFDDIDLACSSLDDDGGEVA